MQRLDQARLPAPERAGRSTNGRSCRGLDQRLARQAHQPRQALRRHPRTTRATRRGDGEGSARWARLPRPSGRRPGVEAASAGRLAAGPVVEGHWRRRPFTARLRSPRAERGRGRQRLGGRGRLGSLPTGALPSPSPSPRPALILGLPGDRARPSGSCGDLRQQVNRLEQDVDVLGGRIANSPRWAATKLSSRAWATRTAASRPTIRGPLERVARPHQRLQRAEAEGASRALQRQQPFGEQRGLARPPRSGTGPSSRTR